MGISLEQTLNGTFTWEKSFAFLQQIQVIRSAKHSNVTEPVNWCPDKWFTVSTCQITGRNAMAWNLSQAEFEVCYESSLTAHHSHDTETYIMLNLLFQHIVLQGQDTQLYRFKSQRHIPYILLDQVYSINHNVKNAPYSHALYIWHWVLLWKWEAFKKSSKESFKTQICMFRHLSMPLRECYATAETTCIYFLIKFSMIREPWGNILGVKGHCGIFGECVEPCGPWGRGGDV